MNACGNHFSNNIKRVWATLAVIVCWQIGRIELKILAQSRIILASPRVTIYWRIESMEPRAYAESRIILIKLRVNNCSFLLSLGLIFASMNGMNYWNTGRLNLDLRNIYVFDVGYIFLYLQGLFLSQIKNCLLVTRFAKY